MISSLNGIISYISNDSLTLDVQGVGFEVFVDKNLLAEHQVGDPLRLLIHMVIRQDLLALYGFKTQDEKAIFSLLLGVDGVGPKLALAILTHISMDLIRNAVLAEKPEYFVRVPGVGKKTAQKIIIHLQGKFPDIGDYQALRGSSSDDEVIESLVALGFSVVEAQTAVQSIPKDFSEDVEERLRHALQFFSTP
ncbi:MAG: Holliday junction branch migration protein RuvA [Anaerolineaceae bacterium]|jgi:Holliday junction DNA helicase RuvA|nr:Holliday junction branch migration protein RuvA [Anaerolineaceae bacterium]MDD4042074.1 Holliday junction branch migration protein RuvA [Anaerolineaceae bacterium]MDD4578101.1 Holliday junction branch migration protein RuvA [Anaerolineaceae bacterium]